MGGLLSSSPHKCITDKTLWCTIRFKNTASAKNMLFCSIDACSKADQNN